MSFDFCYADVLALGDSDEEDPVFEIGIKKKKSHKKASSDQYKKVQEEKKLMEIAAGAKKTRKRNRKKKHDRQYRKPNLKGIEDELLHKETEDFQKDTYHMAQGSDTTCEETKVVPTEATTPTVKGLTEEEVKAADDFIAQYTQMKLDQNFEEQTVTSDIEEERYYGNTEYKLKLAQSTPERILRLTTQMKFRLQEGSGEAYYVIGVGDKGESIGIDKKEMEASLRILHKMATTLELEISIVYINKGRHGEIVKVKVM
uniref:Uncharacterized protein n=1 Tax=Euplotes crassus TaxID=5936 RepID=A0A7S3K7Q7_EUPCR|mmetsp:Transcript_13889/g.13860  ORF Transcript_13889/g.13860 Transcript_13889/m.13860 type:complete len:258 (+) Transcript_13889:11-784(+)